MDRSEWVRVPRSLTAENGAKAALLGEFSVRDSIPCPNCDTPDDDCEHCEGLGLVTYEIAVPWDTIKRIHEAVVALFPPPPAEQASGEPATGLLDLTTYEQIEAVLDRMESPARDYSGKWLTLAERVAALSQRPVVDEAMVFRLAVWMATQDGHDDPHHLIWEGSPPEPWGEVWNRYEDDARAALTAALAPQQPTGEEG